MILRFATDELAAKRLIERSGAPIGFQGPKHGGAKPLIHQMAGADTHQLPPDPAPLMLGQHVDRVDLAVVTRRPIALRTAARKTHHFAAIILCDQGELLWPGLRQILAPSLRARFVR